MFGEGVLKGRQEAAHVGVSLSATQVCGKLVEQGRAARRPHHVESAGSDLTNLAGGLQVTVSAVSQCQPSPLEQGPSLTGVAARDVIRSRAEHLRTLGEEPSPPRSAVSLQLCAAHLNEAVTGLAIQVVVGEEVHPARLLLASVPAGDQLAGGPTGVGKVVVTADGSVRVGESRQDGCPDDRRG